MKILFRTILVLAAASAVGFAQKWEYGGNGGASFLSNVPVSGTMGSAKAGFDTGVAAGAYLGYTQYKHFGGEIRYQYLQSKLSLQSGGTQATFNGASHVVHYDVIFKTTVGEGKVQLFAAAGGGMRIFCGTGTEHAAQALSQFGYFTKTQEVKPMGSVGGGVKFALSKRVFLRTEMRDYITAFPKQIITPAPGTKYGSVLHDLVPMVGIGIEM